MQRMNKINFVIKTALSLILLLLMAAPVAIIIIMYFNKLWIFNGMPAYFASGLIVLVFIIFSINLPLIKEKLYKKKPSFEGLPDNISHLSRNTQNTGINDTVKDIADTLCEALSLTNVIVMLHDRESSEFKKSYSRGDNTEIANISIKSPLVKWFSQNKQIIITERLNKDKKIPSEVREEISGYLSEGIGLIMALRNETKIAGILFAKKAPHVKLKPDKLEWLKDFCDKCEQYIKDSMDYEDWNRGQMASGILDLSSEILSKAVPVNLPKIPEISFGAFYIPRYREGIDYFDIITPTNTGAGVIVTDISGRGLNNAIYSVLLRSAFHSCIEEAHSTFSVMQRLNNALQKYAKSEGGIVKAYYFYYNFNTMRLTYSNAGFQPLEIYRVDKNYYESLETEGFPLGTDITANYGMGRTNLLIGDIGFLYSRSLIDSKNGKGEKFGLTQLREIIKENRRKHPAEITGILKNEFLSFMGSSTANSNVLSVIFKV